RFQSGKSFCLCMLHVATNQITNIFTNTVISALLAHVSRNHLTAHSNEPSLWLSVTSQISLSDLCIQYNRQTIRHQLKLSSVSGKDHNPLTSRNILTNVLLI